MSGKPYRRCSCRDPETKRPLGQRCPDLKKRGHALGWFFRVEVPRLPGEGRRRPERGPFPTEKAASEELIAELARLGGGVQVADRGQIVRDFLVAWLAGKRLRLKPRSFESYEEAVRLYFAPGIGHVRLVDLRDHHLQSLVEAMMQINRPLFGDEEQSEMLRRLLSARADDVRRVLPEGESRRKKSTKPLGPSRIERIFAVISVALNDAVKTHKIFINPFDGVTLPRADHPRPLAWTSAREARFRAELAKRIGVAETAASSEGRVLSTVERQQIWAAKDLRPVPSMVWLPVHAGLFLDYLEQAGERLSVLFIVTMFCGLRRDEVLGLRWAEVSLDEAVLFVRETASGDGPKSDAGTRAVPISPTALKALRAWRKVQAADRLAFGLDWPDADDLVFTREDGSPVPAQWTSTRFEILAYRSGAPAVRFHDLRHGTASLLKAAGVDTTVISAVLGHKRRDFTDRHYVTVFASVAQAAADAADALIPRKGVASGNAGQGGES